jgi:hypothetical protein
VFRSLGNCSEIVEVHLGNSNLHGFDEEKRINAKRN